jgi:DNA polymerase III subunit delta
VAIPFCVLVVGPEGLLADRAVARVLAELATLEPAPAQEFVEASDLDGARLLDLTAPSLFGDERVIVVREAQDLASDMIDALKSFLQAPEPGIRLVLVHKGGVKGKGLLDAARKVKALEISAEAIKKEGEKLDFVRAEFAGSGRTIATDAVRALVDALGNDVRELAAACSQLIADTSGAIDLAAVQRYHAGRVEATGFDVADAAIEGRAGEALAMLRHALATGTDPVLVTSALASGLRNLAKVGSARRGARSAELAGELGMAPWQIDKARRQLPGWSAVGIAGAITAVARADAAVKGSEVDPVHALERALLTITGGREGA